MLKAYVLHSGGMDSTTCLYLAIRNHGKENVKAYSVDYGQLHKRELAAAEEICANLDVPHTILQLGPQPESPLTNRAQNDSIPDKSYNDLGEGISPSYHHYRNGQLLSLLAAFASADLKKDDQGIIYAGQHAEDAANWAYPDCTPEFLGAQANAIYVGTYFKVRLSTPLMYDMKRDVVIKGAALQIPWELTYSCYHGKERHCGVCPTCRSRKAAFLEAQIPDPTEYAA